MRYFSVYVTIFLLLVSCAKDPQKSGEIQTIDEAGYQQLVAQREGRPLVVSFWATWCTVCEDEIPEVSRMHKELRQQGIDLVSISADYSDEIDSKVRPFVKLHQIDYPVFVKDFSDDQRFINAVNDQWSGALPATVVYDSKGRQIAFYEGAVDLDRIAANF